MLPSKLALRMTVLLSFLLSAAMPVGSQASSTPVLDRIRDTGIVRLAHRESAIPFSYYDVDKQPIGYASTSVNAWSTSCVRTSSDRMRYLMVTPSTRMTAIEQGQADLECGSTTNTRERRERVAFTIPHYIAGIRMITRTSSGIRKWDDLRGKNLVTTQGTTSVNELRKLNDTRVLNKKIIEAKDHAEAFSMVEAGKADAFAMDDVLLHGFRANTKSG